MDGFFVFVSLAVVSLSRGKSNASVGHCYGALSTGTQRTVDVQNEESECVGREMIRKSMPRAIASDDAIFHRFQQFFGEY